MGPVPTIDLRGDPPGVAAAIDRACSEIGFFQIVGHGLDPDLESATWVAAQRFFELPEQAKLEVAIPSGGAYGYAPFRSERLAASLGHDSRPDLKETFSVGPASVARGDVADATTDPAAAFVFSPTPWPASSAFEDTMRAYYDALADLVERLMALMAVGLDMAPDTFTAAIDRHTSALRLLHYPAIDAESIGAGEQRAGAHTDYGTLTLLRQDSAPGGLQVRDAAGNWGDVPAVEGAYVVNVGDALERWTNDRWRSTLHRVALPPTGASPTAVSTERFSIAFFHNANWDAVIECLPGCLGPGDTPRYAPVTAGRHLMDKFRSTQ